MKINNFPVTGGDIHRKILVVDTHDNIFTGNFYSKETHDEDCCALEWHNDGFEGSSFYPTKYLKGWMEFPEFNNEIKKQTESITIPIVVPAQPEYTQVQKDYNRGIEIIREYINDGWIIKTVSSATSREVIYNTYILEK